MILSFNSRTTHLYKLLIWYTSVTHTFTTNTTSQVNHWTEKWEALNILEVENQSWEFESTIITAQIFNWKCSCSLCFNSINRKTIMAIKIHLLFHNVLCLWMQLLFLSIMYTNLRKKKKQKERKTFSIIVFITFSGYFWLNCSFGNSNLLD